MEDGRVSRDKSQGRAEGHTYARCKGPYLRLQGRVKVQLLDSNGSVIREESSNNLVVSGGVNALLDILASSANPRVTHMAVGTASTAVAAGQTALQGTELGRTTVSGATVSGHNLTFNALFGTGEGTGTIKEAALLNGATGADMIARFLTGTFTKAATNQLKLEWTLQASAT